MESWQRIDAYHLRNGDWTIAKCYVDGTTIYVLWSGKERIGHFESAEDAMEGRRRWLEQQGEKGNAKVTGAAPEKG